MLPNAQIDLGGCGQTRVKYWEVIADKLGTADWATAALSCEMAGVGWVMRIRDTVAGTSRYVEPTPESELWSARSPEKNDTQTNIFVKDAKFRLHPPGPIC